MELITLYTRRWGVASHVRPVLCAMYDVPPPYHPIF